jgi:hypothetical protein
MSSAHRLLLREAHFALEFDSAEADPDARHRPSARSRETLSQALRAKMQNEWTAQMMAVLGIDVASLPIIWDADFLYGPRTASGDDSYVLCEINVSSVFAIPDQAPAEIARFVAERLKGTIPV